MNAPKNAAHTQSKRSTSLTVRHRLAHRRLSLQLCGVEKTDVKGVACLIALVTAVSLRAPATVAARDAVFETSVAAQPDEDIASDCRYELTLPEPSRMIRATWVIFERGRDIGQIYRDADIRAFARHNHLALLYPFHCAAKAYRDMDIDPSRGLGRGLAAALQQFAAASQHPELSTSKLILLGFSGTGSLVARLAGYGPDRIAAVIATDPGHFDPLGVDTIDLSPQAAAIPQLILVGSADAISGTRRPYAYFRKYFDRGSLWTFVVQNKTPHCCIINAKALMLDWLDAVFIHPAAPNAARFGFIATVPSTTMECPTPFPPASPVWCRGTRDSWNEPNWSVSRTAVARRRHGPEDMIPAGWLDGCRRRSSQRNGRRSSACRSTPSRHCRNRSTRGVRRRGT